MVSQETTRTQAYDAIVHAIHAFRQDQEYCMPHVYGALTAEERQPNGRSAMTVRLYMPSAPPEGDRSLVPSFAREMESKMRWAGMVGALDDLRHQLRLKGILNKFKLANITGQRANTRTRGAQDAVDSNVRKAAGCYRRHRLAYSALHGSGKWEKVMRPLDDKDCRGLGDRLLEQLEQKSQHNVRTYLATARGIFSSGESHYELPWIWYNSTEESNIQVTDGKHTPKCYCYGLVTIDRAHGRMVQVPRSCAALGRGNSFTGRGDASSDRLQRVSRSNLGSTQGSGGDGRRGRKA